MKISFLYYKVVDQLLEIDLLYGLLLVPGV